MKNTRKDSRYEQDDLPPVKNRLLYLYGCTGKLLFCLIFGIGSIVLGSIVLPLMRLFIHPHKRFKKYARVFVSFTFRFFIKLMECTGGLRFKAEHRTAYKELRSTIIVANHPSILDVVFIMALVPNADCIVRGTLSKSIFAAIIRQLYIVNSLGWDELLHLADESLKDGNNLIIFPEGTRTPRHGTNPFKRGAARIAYSTKRDIQPLYIGGTDKYGLGKHDAFFSYNRTGIYVYDIHLLPRIEIADYREQEAQLAARSITKKIHAEIAAEAFLQDNRIV